MVVAMVAQRNEEVCQVKHGNRVGRVELNGDTFKAWAMDTFYGSGGRVRRAVLCGNVFEMAEMFSRELYFQHRAIAKGHRASPALY